ncbi:MAG: oligosaccharide flippase family protein, partial [Gemmatimonadaceae bacterium]
GLERTGWVAAARLAGELLALALIVLLLRDASQVYYVPVAVFAGQALLTLLLIAGLRRMGWRIPVRLDWGAARDTFARSRHLVAFTLLGLVLFNFDLLVIRFVRGSADAGFYSAAYTLIAFGANLIVAFAHTVMPALARLDNAGTERTALFQRAMLQAFAVALPAGVGASLIAQQILGTVFGSSYDGGIAALRILALSLPLAALREIPVVALIANGEERSLVRVNAVTALCNAVLVLAAVPLFGLAGAAWATVATEVIRLALAVRSAREAGFAAIAVSRLWQPGVAALAMAALILLVRPSFLWLSVLLGVLGYALALAILTRGGVLRRGQASHAT